MMQVMTEAVLDSADTPDEGIVIDTATPEMEKQAQRSDRVLKHFREGTLTHALYLQLPKRLQKIYKTMHGYRPAASNEVLGWRRAEKQKSKAQKSAKAARKRNRR